MYQIFYDGALLYDPRDSERIIRDPDCRLAVGEAGELNFTIDPDHPLAGRLAKLKGVLELKAEGRTIYKGRIRKDTQDFYLSRKIESEGLFACLNDSVIPPFEFPQDFLEDNAYTTTVAANGNVIKFFMQWLLDRHNEQVGPTQRIELGEVTVRDPNNYLHRSSGEYLTTREALKQKITDTMSGYLLVDYSGEVTKIHYYADLPQTNVQTVEFGENMLDLMTILDAKDTYTAILPVGADGLTISSLDDVELTPGYVKSGPIIYSTAAEESYGGVRIVRMVEWDDVTVAENLQRKALTQLSTEGIMLSQTIEVTAADLAGVSDSTSEQIARYEVGRYVELRSTPHGFRAAYPLMELEPDIMNPGNTTIVMGATVKAASDLANGNQSDIKDKLDQTQIELDKQQGQITETEQILREEITAAIQTAESIIFSALENYVQTSNLNEFKSTVESQLKIMADNISLNFTETITQINNVNGDLQKTVDTLEKHFDFTLENGLVIKAGPGAMELMLDNDLILFKKNGQQFGWWDGVDFHTGNIVVEVNERAQFGNFAFVPRSNGSLSFLKVGG